MTFNGGLKVGEKWRKIRYQAFHKMCHDTKSFIIYVPNNIEASNYFRALLRYQITVLLQMVELFYLIIICILSRSYIRGVEQCFSSPFHTINPILLVAIISSLLIFFFRGCWPSFEKNFAKKLKSLKHFER